MLARRKQNWYRSNNQRGTNVYRRERHVRSLFSNCLCGFGQTRRHDEVRQRRKYLLQLAGSSRDLARKCSATHVTMHKKDGRLPFLPHPKNRLEVRKIWLIWQASSAPRLASAGITLKCTTHQALQGPTLGVKRVILLGARVKSRYSYDLQKLKTWSYPKGATTEPPRTVGPPQRALP